MCYIKVKYFENKYFYAHLFCVTTRLLLLLLLFLEIEYSRQKTNKCLWLWDFYPSLILHSLNHFSNHPNFLQFSNILYVVRLSYIIDKLLWQVIHLKPSFFFNISCSTNPIAKLMVLLWFSVWNKAPLHIINKKKDILSMYVY